MSAHPAEPLIFFGRFKEAHRLLETPNQPRPIEVALKAWAELELGKIERASTVVGGLLRQCKDPRARAFALMVSGKALGRAGSPVQAVALTRKALDTAAACDAALEPEF